MKKVFAFITLCSMVLTFCSCESTQPATMESPCNTPASDETVVDNFKFPTETETTDFDNESQFENTDSTPVENVATESETSQDDLPILEDVAVDDKLDLTTLDEAGKAELVATTPFLDFDQMWYDIGENKAKASLEYNEKIFQVKVTVLNINTTYFDYRHETAMGTKSFEVHMPTEVLATLTSGTHITVLGELKLYGGYSASLHNAFVVDASLVETKTFDDETIQKAIENYYFNNDGMIDWSMGSGPFFVDNRINFELLTSDTFLTEMDGEWIGKHYVDGYRRQRYITFTSASTADVYEDNEPVYEWSYIFADDLLKFPAKGSNSYEVRKVSDRLVVFYADTIDYVPYWILYKE